MHARRLSQSISSSWHEVFSLSPPPVHAPPINAEEWIKTWRSVFARDLIDSKIVCVEADSSVEDACDLLLSEDIPCLAIKAPNPEPDGTPFLGLFDFSDVNAFLTLAATSHSLSPEERKENLRVDEIVTAARAGRVPVRLVSNFSEKNPLSVLPNDATILSLLDLFSKGTHRALIQSPTPGAYLGMVSDRQLLSWFASYAKETASFRKFLSNSISSLTLPSLRLYSAVVAATSTSTVLDAMRLMNDEGVSSIAVLDSDSGALLSAVSVTDIGKIVVPSESKHVLSAPLHQFIAAIKEPDGSTDGVDKYPVYSVSPSNTLLYTMQKLLATNAHRVFVTHDSETASPALSASGCGTLSGIVSIVDILASFAQIANISDVDPARMRHRRASSVSHSPKSDILLRSRSSSRTGMRRSLSFVLPPALLNNSTETMRTSLSGYMESLGKKNSKDQVFAV